MVHLFGGAIEASVPRGWRDVSQVRQVPDNQEAYQDCAEESGAVLVVEILEHQKDVEDSKACEFFLKDLADANGATTLEQHQIYSEQMMDIVTNSGMKQLLLPTFSIPESTSNLCVCIARGSQKVVQGKDKAERPGEPKIEPHWVDIEICILRLASVETDLLITLSTPRKETSNNTTGERGMMGVVGGHSDVFKQVLSSFNIVDWSLFG